MKIFHFLFLFLPLFVQSQSDYDKAVKLFNEKKFEEARPLFEKLLTKDVDNLIIIEYLGDIHGNLQHWDNCIFYYNKLKSLQPTEANYYYKFGGGLGMKASQNKNIASLKLVDRAKESFEKAIILNPKHIEARYALIKIYTELPGFVGGSYKKAYKYADELLKISPVDGYLAKGIIEEYKENYTQAEINYKTAYSIGKSKVSYQKLYNLYVNKLKQPEKAKVLEKV
jgi:tetratricopeptide (TPR) repeat protein